MQLNDAQLCKIRSNWSLQATNCLLKGEQVPLPPEPLLKCGLDASEAAMWRGSVAKALRECRDVALLPHEWKAAQQAQQNTPTGATLGAELTAYRVEMARAAALGNDPSDPSETVAPPAPTTILDNSPAAALTRHRNEQAQAAARR